MARFSTPTKKIFESSDLGNFRKSLAYKRLHQTIRFIVEKMKGTDVPEGCLKASIVTRSRDLSHIAQPKSCGFDNLSGPAAQVVKVLEHFELLIDQTPPLKGPRRFGNFACRDWHAKIEADAGSLVNHLISKEDASNELEFYLVNAFGSAVRLDYGLGHELSFIAFIGGLMECGFIGSDIAGTDLLAIFAKYYDLVRRLIIEYSLEPAGSHGVWGLDDHFHFIYILGASQFNTDKGESSSRYIPPVQSVLQSETLELYLQSNLYVNAIAFIFKIKSGPFNEHSPILYDIHRSVSLWSKVLSGLLKMYEVEVFGKFPVVQHFWFGDGFFPWKDAETMKDLPTKDNEPEGSKQDEDEMPGLINGFQGTKTTHSNISVTAAPWAQSRRQPASAFKRDKLGGSSHVSSSETS